MGVPRRFLKKISTIILEKNTHPFNSSGILNLTKYLQEHNFKFENDLSDGEKKTHEDEASYMAASERKLTHKQQPEEVLMNLSREDQRKNRHEWVEAECAEAEA